MRPDARAQSAIEILDIWLSSEQDLDRILTDWGRRSRYAGSGDRRAIADLVYNATRRMRSSAWIAGSDDVTVSGRALIHGNLIQAGLETSGVFTGERHAPAPLSETEIAAQRSLESAPRLVRTDMPEWLAPWVATLSDADLLALRDRASVDLRVNSLKTDLAAARQSLATDGIITEPLPGIVNALRVRDGAHRVHLSAAYLGGLVEIQDAGSQQLALLAKARPGERILDLCAGGGGKALAMAAAAAGGRAIIHAYDVSSARLEALPARAKRAGASIEIIDRKTLEKSYGTYDVVFVDAPCSGSGAWRRNPDAKWRLTEARLQSLIAVQSELLEQARELLQPEGRIIYGTCSILDGENASQIDQFLKRHPTWSLVDQLHLLPSSGTDGFFGALLSQVVDSR
ncbi:MAG: RsmB/NOP family class I SAM-dependent RNA methyltransferase [Pseudomonadota bacterium]